MPNNQIFDAATEYSQEYKFTVIVVIDTYDQCEFIIWLYLLRKHIITILKYILFYFLQFLGLFWHLVLIFGLFSIFFIAENIFQMWRNFCCFPLLYTVCNLQPDKSSKPFA